MTPCFAGAGIGRPLPRWKDVLPSPRHDACHEDSDGRAAYDALERPWYHWADNLYFGLLDIGRPQAGETVAVSGAAGATGSVVGQIAKIKGCRVVGIAGGPEKCEWLTGEAGFDAAIDYKMERVQERLRELGPEGINIFFDNVGGDILDAALALIAMKARVVLCGGISRYNEEDLPPGPKNYFNLVLQRGRMEGFIVLDYASQFEEAVQELTSWVTAGKVKYQEDIQEGFANAPKTFLRLFEGNNFGKQLLKIADPPLGGTR